MADPKELTDRIAREENEADRTILDRHVIAPIGKALKSAKDYVLGTDEQNEKAAKKMRKQDEANPDTFQAKVNKAIGYGGYAKGGTVSSASKRADGVALRGKTRGKVC